MTTEETETASTQQMKKASELDQGWLRGDGVCSLSGPYEEEEVLDLKIDSEKKLEFAWFAVKASMGSTELEEREKNEAIKKQIEYGILKPNGMPYGFKSPEEKNEKPKKPMGKLARKMLRARDRAIQKDINKQIKEEKQNKNNFNLKI